jgi:thymidylate synthase
MDNIIQSGIEYENDFWEISNAVVAFEVTDLDQDDILKKYCSPNNVLEMEKVFFSDGANSFGHSYRNRWRGPNGKNDLTDIISMLKSKPTTKRAILTFESDATKTPCINIIHFTCRNNILYASYFSRGQDIFNKFYADAFCIQKFGQIIAEELNVPLERITGFISSAHIYNKDLARAKQILLEIGGTLS